MLIRTNMEDLREKTHEKHYELYRKMRLEQVKIESYLIIQCSSFKSNNMIYFIDGL
jgi:septin family protein